MKKILFVLLISFSGVFSNEIQVFTANTMKIDLDDKSLLMEIFYCKNGDKCIELVEKDTNGDILIKGTVYNGAVAIGSTALKSSSNLVTSGTGTNLQAGGVGALAGLAVVSSVYFVHDIFASFTKDYEYIITSYAKNSLGEETLLKTLIVADDELTDKEAKKIAFADQKKLLLGEK